MRAPRLPFLLAALASVAWPSDAQTINEDTPPAHIAFLDGESALDRDDETEAATPGMPFVPGDRLRTGRGRAEVLFPDGTALAIDEHSTVEINSNTLLRVTQGRIVLIVARAGNAGIAPYAIDTPTASVVVDGAGEYRVSILSGPSGAETALAIVRGSATLTNDGGTLQLRAGEQSVASDRSATRPEPYNSARADAFYRWAADRRNTHLATTSRDYLPSDLSPYARELEQNGDWQYQGSDGYVWYPNVAPDWRPYYDGYWSAIPAYGWTWVGVNTWAWPTHHYGRWGYARSKWFWIPDRRWSPAWVSWGAATGYVSWCPLGFDNRPVFALSASVGHKWNAWTVLPREHFGGGRYYVHQFAVKPAYLPQRASFVVAGRSPALPPKVAARRLAGPPSRDNGPQRQWRASRDSDRSRGAAANSSFGQRPDPAGERRRTSPVAAAPGTGTPARDRDDRRTRDRSPDRAAAPGIAGGMDRRVPDGSTDRRVPPEGSRNATVDRRGGGDRTGDTRTSTAPPQAVPVPARPSEGSQWRTSEDRRRAEPVRAAPTEDSRPANGSPNQGRYRAEPRESRRGEAAAPSGREPANRAAAPREAGRGESRGSGESRSQSGRSGSGKSEGAKSQGAKSEGAKSEGGSSATGGAGKGKR